MSEFDIEKQPLNTPSNITIVAPAIEKTIAPRTGSQILDVRPYDNYKVVTDNIIFNIEESLLLLNNIRDAQRQVYEHAIDIDNNTAQNNRTILERQTALVNDRLSYIRQAIITVEPSKPTLSDLELRNQRFKTILRSYKDLLEKYINITLESQRFTSVLFEEQIKSVNPHATAFDLERAISSTGDDCPSVFVQILMQRGIRKNDKTTQHVMHIVQDIHQDLRLLALAFTQLSEMRNEVNIVIERYRRRWPVLLREGEFVYVIDDNLNLLQKALVGTHIDFDALLRKREQRNKLVVSAITLITAIVVLGIVISSTLFSDF
ncbi:hypothetical protein BD408DRAFT_408406 [Parasitella parasitica]|nr:hypothetical protein BD408DRAFT_408406 [Parasitella parasitica]